MHIYGPTHLHGAQPVNAPHSAKVNRPQTTTQCEPVRDELEISDAAQLLDKVHELPEIRQDRVNEIRAQIAAGTYETDEKLDIALGRLLDEIG